LVVAQVEADVCYTVKPQNMAGLDGLAVMPGLIELRCLDIKRSRIRRSNETTLSG